MNAVTIIIYNSCNDNRPVNRVCAKGYYGGGMNKFPTTEVKTDDKGRCVLTWNTSDRRLVEIYVAGEKHTGEFYPGETYTFNTKRA